MAASTRVDELFARHYVALVRLAAQLVDDRESAEDVVQEVFAAFAPDRVHGDPLRYLRTAVVNRARSTLRRRGVARAFALRRQRVELAEPADAATERGTVRAAMLAAIDGLPRRQREALILRYYEELSVAEIAEVLGASPGAISMALNRALTTLGDRIGADHD